MQLMPMRRGTHQYVIFWYIAETLPPQLEPELETKKDEPYKNPPQFPPDLTLKERVKMEPEGYEPVHHENTGVDEEEQTYTSYLLPIEEAVDKLGRRGVMADVVVSGWNGILERFAAEEGGEVRAS